MNKTYVKIILSISIVIIAAAVFYCLQFNENGDRTTPINDGITSFVEFDVGCSECGTSTEGTIFVMQSRDSVKLRVVADLTVGETDKEGLDFFIPKELDITGIQCSYKGVTSSEYVTLRPYPEGGNDVYVAQTHIIPSGGGDGVLVMDLQLNGLVKLKDIDSFVLSISAAETVVEKVVIPITY